MVCRNCQKSTLDPNLRSTVVSDCGCAEHTQTDPAELLIDEEAKMSRRVDSNRAMVVSYNGKSIMAIVDKLIQYTRCLIRNLITHVVDHENRIERLEGNGGELAPVRRDFEAGFMYTWTCYRIGNTVFVASEVRQIAEAQASAKWITLPVTVPEGFRPIQPCQVFSFRQAEGAATIQRKIYPSGEIHYLCTEGVPADSWVITPSTSWLTVDPYPS